MAEAETYLHTLDIDAIKAQAIRVKDGAPFALTPNERREYLAHLQEVGRNIVADIEAGRMPRDDRFNSRVLQLMTKSSRKTYCEAGIHNFGITPDGTLVSCILLDKDENRMGHIDDAPQTWRSAGKKWVENARHDTKCVNCDALPLCGGGCPAITPFCGESECELVKQNCIVAREIFDHFKGREQDLLGLRGIF